MRTQTDHSCPALHIFKAHLMAVLIVRVTNDVRALINETVLMINRKGASDQLVG